MPSFVFLCAIVRRLAWQADQQSDKLMQAIHGANGEVSAMHFLAARDAVSSSAEQVRARACATVASIGIRHIRSVSR